MYTDDQRIHDRMYAKLCAKRTLEDVDVHGLRMTEANDIYLDMITGSRLVYQVDMCRAMYLVSLGDMITQRKEG